MNLLFTSDLHGLLAAYERFAELLATDDYDAGVIAGDLTTHLAPYELSSLLSERGMAGDDLLDELDSPDAPTTNSPKDQFYAEGVVEKSEQLRGVLLEVGKPVFYVMGNDDGIVADGVEWPSDGTLHNVNQARVEFQTFNFVGYQFTNPLVGGRYEKPEPEQELDLQDLARLVDNRTILVTHGPPFGTLDRGHSRSLGSNPLAAFVRRTEPWLHLFGHIHQSFGVDGHSINGAFPLHRQFVSIRIETRKVLYIDAVSHAELVADAECCATCQQYSAGYCHKWNDQRDPDETHGCWEPRREVDGWTVWEVLDREG